MTRYISWIPQELRVHHPRADFKSGVDLNRNGYLEPNEKIRDYSKNGIVGDHADWIAFIKKNSTAIQKLGGVFRWGRSLKPDNPIHDIISIESYTKGIQDAIGKTKYAYKMVNRIVRLVKRRLSGRNYTPQKKLKLVYSTIQSLGIKITTDKSPPSTLLIENINSKWLDGDTSSFIVKAVAHEMAWPVYLVNAQEHMFARWDYGNGTHFNIDNGIIKPDKKYVTQFRISKHAIDKGVYLKNLKRNELFAHVFCNRGWQTMKFAHSAGVSDPKLAVGLQRAISIFDKAIVLNPQSARAYCARGAIKYQLKKYNAAISDLNKSLALSPNYWRARGYRALAHYYSGRYRKALEDFNKSISIKPDDYSYYARARINLRLGNYREAIRDINKALKYPSKSKWVFLLYRGKAKAGLKQYGEAINDFNSIISKYPTDGLIYIERGKTYAMLGKYSEAIKNFNTAIKLNTPKASKAEAYACRGIAWSGLGEHSGATKDFQKAKSIGPKNVKVYQLIAGHYAKKGKYKKALELYNKAVSLGKKNARSYYERGKLLASLGKHRSAIKDFNKAIEFDPEVTAKYYLARGKSNAAIGRFHPALEDFDRSKKLDSRLKVSRHKRMLGVIPELGLGARLRFRSAMSWNEYYDHYDKYILVDGGISLSATWYLANLYKNLSLGMGINFGYAGSSKHNMLDLSGSLALITQFGDSTLTAEFGAGYAFLLSGNDEHSALTKGGFLGYGLRYNYRIYKKLAIGASFAMQHKTADPKEFAVVPGIDLSINLW